MNVMNLGECTFTSNDMYAAMSSLAALSEEEKRAKEIQFEKENPGFWCHIFPSGVMCMSTKELYTTRNLTPPKSMIE